MMHPMHKKLQRALDRMGGFYALSDILELDWCTKHMQSFA